jgi:hypothetical protein
MEPEFQRESGACSVVECLDILVVLRERKWREEL